MDQNHSNSMIDIPQPSAQDINSSMLVAPPKAETTFANSALP